jgi:DNA repair protein RecN (Recombination protein N)
MKVFERDMPKSQLVELYAHGLGVIQEARLEFGSGFNVLTGETGAGKTLLLGALQLCLGGDALNRDAAAPDMRAAAVFSLDGDRDVVLERELTTSGRLRSAVDGVPSSAEALRTFAQDLIVIHGQHDSLTLRSRAAIVKIVDESGGVSTESLVATRERLSDARRSRDQLGGDAGARERELDFVTFQIRELESAQVSSPRELEETLAELTRLTELREGEVAILAVADQLDADRETSVLTQFAEAINAVPNGDAYDGARALLRSALELAREGVHELAALGDPEAYDAEVIARLEERASVLQQLARKYGGSLEAALALLEDLQRRRDVHHDATATVARLDQEIEALIAEERALAKEVRRAREEAAVALTNSVMRQLPRVALAHAKLRIEVDGDDGSLMQVLFTANPGQPEGTLQSLASGGELSRVLLALSLETAHEDIVTVFDEVDAGIGGQVAQQIGECLREVGQRQQVLAVTHLASVAAKADHHLVIEKTVRKNEVYTTVRVVRGDERVDEIARMLAGDTITSESRSLARQMLETPR